MRFYPIDLVDNAAKLRPEGYRDDVMSSGTALFDAAGNLRAVMMTDQEYKKVADKYRDMPGKSEPTYGPGTELKALLGMIGIKASPNCSCNARAKKMDDMGVEWCEKNVTTIVGWLQEEADKRRLPFSRFAARKLVQTAIARAARNETKSRSVRA